jgi:hypothetical protein
MSELKFVEGGWYQMSSGSTHKVMRAHKDSTQPWMCECCGVHWNEDGTWEIELGPNYRDLVRRVAPPVDYVATKKWLWEFTVMDVETKDRIIVRTITHFEKPPAIVRHLSHGDLQKVEGSEVEE